MHFPRFLNGMQGKSSSNDYMSLTLLGPHEWKMQLPQMSKRSSVWIKTT